MTRLGTVYALIDPTDGRCRYVGITIQDLKLRMYGHLNDAKAKGRTHKERWIAKLLKQDLRPIVQILEDNLAEEQLGLREQYWIQTYKDAGTALTNCTAGGEGILNPTAETRFKIGTANRGKKFSPEICEKFRQRQLGRKHSEETKRKMAAAHTGRKMSPEAIAKSVESRRGQKMSDTTKRAIRAANLGRKHSQASCDKRSASLSRFKKPVVDQNGTIYESIAAAGRAIGVKPHCVLRVANGTRKSVKGFSFSFLEIPTSVPQAS